MAIRIPPSSRTQEAFDTPFESEPERPNGFTAKTVQEAIEEALNFAIANDRFLILADYNGNGISGRLLEFFSGLDSSEAPLFFDDAANIKQIVSSTTSVSSNATIGFYDIVNDPGLLTPLFTLDMNNQKRVIENGSTLFTIPAGGALTIMVDSGSILKPHLQIVFSSAL